MKNKRIVIFIGLLALLLASCGTSDTTTPTEPDTPSEPSEDDNTGDDNKDDNDEEEPSSSEIFPLNSTKKPKIIESDIKGVKAYGEYLRSFNSDLTSYDFTNDYDLLMSLNISNKTKFNKDYLPLGYDQQKLIDWGKESFLNMDLLKEYGFDGTGINIAYADVIPYKHEELVNQNITYSEIKQDNDSQYHGTAVLSILTGKELGVIPNAHTYFFGVSDNNDRIDALKRVVEVNNTLPNDQKIKMIGMSAGLPSDTLLANEMLEAAKKCQENNIMVWMNDIADINYYPGSFIPFSNRNNPNNLIRDASWNDIAVGEKLVIPCSGKSVASNEYNTNDGTISTDYNYFATGGVSWGMPITCALASIAKEINDSLTQKNIIDLFYSTAYKKINEMGNVINPVGFVAQVLTDVGRTTEATTLLNEVDKRENYSYALINTSKLSNSDITAINNYLATITNTKFYYFDTKNYTSYEDIYTTLQADYKTRLGVLGGVLIFGNDDLVPSFNIKYKVDTVLEGIDDGNYMKTDFFYSSFDNDIESIKAFNVMDYYYGERDIDLIPKWKVSRLMLPKGYFTNYFNNYNTFLAQKHGTNPYICSFVNPVSPYTYKDKGWKDDLNVLIKNCADVFNIIDDHYRMFGNLQGDYIGDTPVEGDFITDNLTLTNKEDSYEYVIYTHGQENNLDRTIFDGDQGARISLINSENANNVLHANPYYFDAFTCTNASQLKSNLIETMLEGNCVGAFAISCAISWGAEKGTIKYFGSTNPSDLEDCTFYYFIYEYLYHLYLGYSRSDAFFKAKQLSLEKMVSLQDKEGYTMVFNLNTSNNIFYQNFGVFETNYSGNLLVDTTSLFNIEEDLERDSTINYSGGKRIGEVTTVNFKKNKSIDIDLNITSSSYQLLDNNYVRFDLELDNKENDVYQSVFGGGDNNNFSGLSQILIDNAQKVSFDVSKKEIIEKAEFILLFSVNNKDSNRCFYSLQTNDLYILKRALF